LLHGAALDEESDRAPSAPGFPGADGRIRRIVIELVTIHIRDGQVTKLIVYLDRDGALADLGLKG
jgi:hypothetical protein